MSDYYWPTRQPTPLQIDYILQVRYSLHEVNDDRGISEIRMVNLNDEDQTPTHHVYIPKVYQKDVKRLLWRYYLLLKLYIRFQTRKAKVFLDFLPHLEKIIVHLDNVVESFFRPCGLYTDDEMGAHRSANFEEYLITEFLIGNHQPAIVNEFRYRCPHNIERMTLQICGKWYLV